MSFATQLNSVPVILDIRNNSKSISLDIKPSGTGGTTDYEHLHNKPSINGVELTGNRTSSEIHVQHEMHALSEEEIDEIIFGE